MEVVNAGQLKRVIEGQHGGTSTFIKSVRVHQARGNQVGWDGLVHVFDLKDHPKAKRAYAWSSPIRGGTKPRFFAVLHMGQVTGPVEAVKAASAAIRKWGAQGTRNST
ncbi:MAG: hypothetical protein ACLQUZ_04330 [Rhizomicrobium sp.]